MVYRYLEHILVLGSIGKHHEKLPLVVATAVYKVDQAEMRDIPMLVGRLILLVIRKEHELMILFMVQKRI